MTLFFRSLVFSFKLGIDDVRDFHFFNHKKNCIMPHIAIRTLQKRKNDTSATNHYSQKWAQARYR